MDLGGVGGVEGDSRGHSRMGGTEASRDRSIRGQKHRGIDRTSVLRTSGWSFTIAKRSDPILASVGLHYVLSGA